MCLEEISASFLTELLQILSIVGQVTKAVGREVSTQIQNKISSIMATVKLQFCGQHQEELVTQAVRAGAAPTGFLSCGQVRWHSRAVLVPLVGRTIQERAFTM